MPFDVASVRDRLPGRQIEWFQSVSSTMTIAGRLARDGCATGTIVGADGQVAGIGRHGHTWQSEACAGLYVSIVLRLPLAARDLPLHARPSENSRVAAVLASRAVARLDRCDHGWCRLSVDKVSGWARAGEVWGTEPEAQCR